MVYPLNYLKIKKNNQIKLYINNILSDLIKRLSKIIQIIKIKTKKSIIY